MATTDMNAQIHIKDGNGNVNNIFPATKIANVEGLTAALNAKADTTTVTNQLSGKVDKETGKGLSTNDYTTAEKNKLSGIEAQANKTVVDSELSSSSENPVQNKVVKAALDQQSGDLIKAKTYVTPEMYGAVGDGTTDDTNAFKTMLADSNAECIHLNHVTYKLTDTLDFSQRTVIGNCAVLDFSESAESVGVTAANKAILTNFTVRGGDTLDYGLYLDYFANGSELSNITVKECINGIYLAASWYASFRDIIVKCGTVGKCLEFGSSTIKPNSSEINAVTFDNVSLQGGEYGLYAANTVITANAFNNIAVERNSKCGIVLESTTRGSISLNAAYFEAVAVNSTTYTDGLLITAYDDMLITMQNVLLRGTYTQNPRPKLLKGHITSMPKVYNATTGADYGDVERILLTSEDTYKRLIPNQSIIYTGTDLIIPVRCNSQSNLHLSIEMHFRASGDTTMNACIYLDIYLDIQSSTPTLSIVERVVKPGYLANNFTATYNITTLTDGKKIETITITNSNSRWANGTKKCMIEGSTYENAYPILLEPSSV